MGGPYGCADGFVATENFDGISHNLRRLLSRFFTVESMSTWSKMLYRSYDDVFIYIVVRYYFGGCSY